MERLVGLLIAKPDLRVVVIATILSMCLLIPFLFLRGNPNQAEGPLQVEAVNYPFKLTLTLNKTVFRLGESVNVTIKLVNISEDVVNLTFRHSGPPGWLRIRVYNIFNQLIYESSPAAWGVITDVVLNPEEYITQTHEWEPKTAGTYKIIGFVADILDIPTYPHILMETPPIKIIVA